MGTHLHRPRSTAALLCALAAGAACGWSLPATAGAAPRPTGDLVERFFADPRTDPSWHASGVWSWEPAATAVVSGGAGAAEFLRTGSSHFAGTIAARLKLPAVSGGAGAAARVVFAFDAASGAHRWLEVRAGSPGRLVLGQTGALGGSPEGVIQTWRATIAAGVWHDVSVRIAGTKAVTVTLDARQLFTAAAAPLVPGLVGFGARGAGVAVDSFTFTADPDGEPCKSCHAGQPEEPLAANVYTYWDGRWWDATYAGSTSTQQGGHGDPGGKQLAPASCNGATTCHALRPRTFGTHPSVPVTCTGPYGCHDMRLPAPGDHRNGVREGRPSRGGRGSVNAYHLRSGFIVAEPRNPWSAQVTFDNYCFSACHAAINVADDRHERDTLPADPNHHSMELGTHLTGPDGESLGVFVDSDLTSRATTTEPDYVPCVACHDPHGTPTTLPSMSSTARNKMMRKHSTDPTFCSGPEGCHM